VTEAATAAAPAPTGNNDAPPVERISADNYDKLDGTGRRDYARQFDQSKMPEWHDPRTSPAEQTAGDQAAGDAIDPSKAEAGAKYKFVGGDGQAFELDGAQLQQALAKHAADLARAATLPGDPTKYEAKLPADVRLPGGAEFRFNEADPAMADLRNLAHRNGWDQATFESVLAVAAMREARDVARLGAARQAEIDKLGATGVSRVKAVEDFLDGMGASGLKGRIFTERDVRDFERLIDRQVRQGAAPMPMGKRDAPEQPGRVSAEQYDKMNVHEKWAYARQHSNPRG